MREPVEMVTASLMQNVVQIRQKNTCFTTKLLFTFFGTSSFGALDVESPHGGDITKHVYVFCHSQILDNMVTYVKYDIYIYIV